MKQSTIKWLNDWKIFRAIGSVVILGAWVIQNITIDHLNEQLEARRDYVRGIKVQQIMDHVSTLNIRLGVMVKDSRFLATRTLSLVALANDCANEIYFTLLTTGNEMDSDNTAKQYNITQPYFDSIKIYKEKNDTAHLQLFIERLKNLMQDKRDEWKKKANNYTYRDERLKREYYTIFVVLNIIGSFLFAVEYLWEKTKKIYWLLFVLIGFGLIILTFQIQDIVTFKLE